jgi:hypothetical protein
VSLRPRHEYAAGFPHGLPASFCIPTQEFSRSPEGMTCIRTASGPDLPGSSRCLIERRKTPVPRVLLSITLAGPAPSGSTGHVPASSGPLSPSPASPRSDCPQLQPHCCDSGLVQVFHLHSNQQRLTAQTEVEPEPGIGQRLAVDLDPKRQRRGSTGMDHVGGADRRAPPSPR